MNIVLEIFRQSGIQLIQLLPYVLMGAFLGAILQRYKVATFSKRLKELPLIPLMTGSAVLGILSPFCTIGTVPVVIGLIGSGLPIGGGIAFLAASSMANPQMLLIQYATVGPILTASQGISALIIGLLAGGIGTWCEKRGYPITNPATPFKPKASGHRGIKSLFQLFLDQLEFVLLYMIIGVIASSVITVCLNMNISSWLNIPPTYTVIAGTLLSVPLYVCGGSVMPVMASLMGKGLPPGAALAFMIAGPATRLQVLAALKTIMNKKALAGYVTIIIIWAVMMGIIANLWFSRAQCYSGLQ